MWVLVNMDDTVGIETLIPAFYTMDLISLFQEQFGKIGTVLASNPGNQCSFSSHALHLSGIYRQTRNTFVLSLELTLFVRSSLTNALY